MSYLHFLVSAAWITIGKTQGSSTRLTGASRRRRNNNCTHAVHSALGSYSSRRASTMGPTTACWWRKLTATTPTVTPVKVNYGTAPRRCSGDTARALQSHKSPTKELVGTCSSRPLRSSGDKRVRADIASPQRWLYPG